MTILVIGGTGTVGSKVVSGLAAKNLTVRCMTRVPDSLKNLPQGVEGVQADMEKPATLKAAFKGVRKVFLITPLSQNETLQGIAAVQAAKIAEVEHIVYMSVPMPKGAEVIPHFRSKVPVEGEIKSSGIPFTILRPNNFFQNDYWCRAAVMLYNTYPQPIGSIGLNRIDARDIADAAINALTQSGHENREYELHGPDVLNGDAVAAVYSKYLNKQVSYGGDDLEAWSKQAQHMMPEWMVRDLRIMYGYFQHNGFLASANALAEQQKVIGHAPRTFDQFVAEILPEWRALSQQ